MTRKYYIIYDVAEVEVFPVADLDLNIERVFENNEWYAREFLSKKVKFQNDYVNGSFDFSTIQSQDYTKEIKFIIREDTDNYASIRWQGYFTVNDGEWDLDTCSVEIDIQPDDYYRTLLDAFEDEYLLSEFSDKKTLYIEADAEIEEIRIGQLEIQECGEVNACDQATETVAAIYGDRFAFMGSCVDDCEGNPMYDCMYRRIKLKWKPNEDWDFQNDYYVHECSVYDPCATTEPVPIYFNNVINLFDMIEFIINDVLGTNVVSLFFTEVTNPVTLAANAYNNIYIGQISDFRGFKGEDSTTGKVSLQILLEWLRNTFNVYWDIMDNGDFRIEHYSYYDNGLAYSGDPTISYDLTSLFPTWLEGTNKITYEKQEMYGREKWAWLFAQSEDFIGKDIIYESPVKKRRRKESNSMEYSLSELTTDLPALINDPEEAPTEGYVFLSGGTQVDSGDLMSDWISVNYDSFSSLGHTVIAGIKNTVLNVQKARTNSNFTFEGGLSYDIDLTVSVASGTAPFIYFALTDGTPISTKVRLTAGVNHLRIKCNNGGTGRLYLETPINETTQFGISAIDWHYHKAEIIKGTGKLTGEELYNADLSLANLHDKLFRHGRPIISGNMNGALETFFSAKRTKIQSGVQFPFCAGTISEYELVSTDVGDGRPIKVIFREDGVADLDLAFA